MINDQEMHSDHLSTNDDIDNDVDSDTDNDINIDTDNVTDSVTSVGDEDDGNDDDDNDEEFVNAENHFNYNENIPQENQDVSYMQCFCI